MEDGRMITPHSSHFQTPITSHLEVRKAQSLPGFYNKISLPPQSFKDAFTSNYNPISSNRALPPTASASRERKEDPSKKGYLPQETSGSRPNEEKKSRRFLGGFFRRRRKDESSSSSNSDEEEPRRSFFARKPKKKEARCNPKVNNQQNESLLCSSKKIDQLDGKTSHNHQSSYFLTTDSGKVIKMSPTGSLGREVNYYSYNSQPLGIPPLSPQQSNLGRSGVSVSHDSLAPSAASWNSESAYGSINSSSIRSSALGMAGRSSSSDTISRKERKDALKVRVERLRERNRGSSSDEEGASMSSQFGSENSLNKSDSFNNRSRSSRTERYLRRKSQELEVLRVETEKDRRNREAVQARILEIQKDQKSRADKKQKESEGNEKNEKPKWSAKLVYQESNEYDSVIIRTPSESPGASPRAQSKLHNQPRSYDPSNLRRTPSNTNMQINATLSLDPYLPSRRSFQDVDNTFGGIQGQRSISYESNINKAASLPPNYMNRNPPRSSNSEGLTPPAPPPRDKSRLLSPWEPHRPISYSFESLSQEPSQLSAKLSGGTSHRNSFHKGSSPNPPPRIGPLSSPSGSKYKDPCMQLPPATPCRRSFSEKQLTFPDDMNGLPSSPTPARPIPPKLYPLPSNQSEPHQSKISSSLIRSASSNLYPSNSYQGQHNSFYSPEKSVQLPKVVPTGSVAPSPSSDYSSYISDNSVRTQQKAIPSSNPIETEVMKSSFVSKSIIIPNLSSVSNSPKNSQMHLKLKTDLSDVKPKPRPSPLTLKQAESMSSLSGQSDIPSPAKHLERVGDSDSSQSSGIDPTKTLHNRPLSMVLEKSESCEKDSPPIIPRQKPQPPKRNSSSMSKGGRDFFRQHFQALIDAEKDEKQAQIERQKKLEEMYKKEKERLQKSKCANFEEALFELEEIYKSLNLNNEDIMEGAEKMDKLSGIQQDQLQSVASPESVNENISEELNDDRGRSKTPKLKRSNTPDKTTDDLHYRRVQLSNRNQPDVKKALQMTGSYLLVSPVHGPPSIADQSLPKDQLPEKEPDVVSDDVTYRNIQRANSIKIIDPQPPFGIPLGPVTQASPSDYLHNSPATNYRQTSTSSAEPDIVMDDMAFRSLRKDDKTSSNKSLNVSELDELLSETNDSPNVRKRLPRSASADRMTSVHSREPQAMKTEAQTPRKVKQQHRAKRCGRFYDSFKEAWTDSEGASVSAGWRRNPSWVERAHLSDNKWENLSTSTETLTELTSVKAVSQPDIRQAIIREAREPPGGPNEISLSVNQLQTPSEDSSIPHRGEVNLIHSTPSTPLKIETKPYRPLDAIYNNKPKPFYISSDISKKPDPTYSQSPVDIAKLDDLISTITAMENNNGESRRIGFEKTDLEKHEESTAVDSTTSSKHSTNETQNISVDQGRHLALINIEKAIRNSMVTTSSSIEDELNEDQQPTRQHKSSSSRLASSNDATQRDNDKRKRRIEYERQRINDEKKRTVDKGEKEALSTRRSKDTDKKKIVREDKKRNEDSRKQTIDKKENEKRVVVVKEVKEKLLINPDKARVKKREIKKEDKLKTRSDKEKSAKTLKEIKVEKSNEEPIYENAQIFSSVEELNSQSIHSTMVQEGRVSESSDKQSPLKPIRTMALDEKSDKAEQEKKDRIQRYKEERRRQMAARYGTIELSSSDEENPQNNGSSTHRRRRRQRTGLDSSSTDLSTGEARRSKENGSPLDSRNRKPKEGSSSEDVRRSKHPLRRNTVPTTQQSASSEGGNNNNVATLLQDEIRICHKKDTSSDQSLQRVPLQEGRVESPDSTLSGSEGRGSRRRTSTEEKDKSHKRKSHLNRAATSEEAVYPASHLSDSSEDVPRRRRRRTPAASDSPFTSSPVNTTPDITTNHAALRLTPPSTPSSVVTSTVDSSGLHSLKNKKALAILPPTPLTPIRPSTSSVTPRSPVIGSYSAPSTLDVRTKADDKLDVDELSPKSNSHKLSPLKIAPLRKPEIPEVLRPKDSSGLTSPGVVHTPPTSRPSSVVLDKPPVGPEGIIRAPNLRSSLRKPPESGTCFMATRRDKREDEYFDKDINQRNEEYPGGTRIRENTANADTQESWQRKPSTQEVGVDNPKEQVGVKSHLDQLTAQALELKSRAEVLSGDKMVQECEHYLNINKDNIPLRTSSTHQKEHHSKSDTETFLPAGGASLGAMKGIISDTGQKNWIGGPEGSGDKVIRRLAFEEEVKEKSPYEANEMNPTLSSSSTPLSSGPPYYSTSHSSEDSVHGILKRFSNRKDDEGTRSRSPDLHQSIRKDLTDSEEGNESPPRTRSPSDHYSFLRRRSSREDFLFPSSSEKSLSQGILKRKPCPRASSFDVLEGDPRPILKKRSSADEDFSDPKSILKKKSLTDDELELDRPRSILKGARSREELTDRSDGVVSPAPILKRSSRVELEEGGELRPILKRRDTSDGVRHTVHMSETEVMDAPMGRVRSDSAPEAGFIQRSHSPPLPSVAPSHGILKRRPQLDATESELGHIFRSRRSFAADLENDEPRRPLSPSLVLLTSPERPLSVAERVAGMEALQGTVAPSPGAKPKVRTSSEERTASPLGERDRETTRRNSWVSPLCDILSPDLEGGLGPDARPIAETFNPMFGQPSRVSQKAAFFAKFDLLQLEQEKGSPSATTTQSASTQRKERGTRFSTQPITEGEVSKAARLVDDASDDNSGGVDSEMSSENKETRTTKSSSTDELMEGLGEKRLYIDGHVNLSRKLSTQEQEDETSQVDTIRGILKSEPGRERAKDSPRSILKPDSRKSSMTETEHPKGILKSDSPLSSTIGSPEHDSKPLRSVLKKDSSSEDSKEIRSILKPESESLEPEISSDSSSEITQDLDTYSANESSVQSINHTLIDSYCSSSLTKSEFPETSRQTRPSEFQETTRQTRPSELQETSRQTRPSEFQETSRQTRSSEFQETSRQTRSSEFQETSRQTRSTTKKQVMQDAVKQALPMKTKDNLAEALRQIEPIRGKSKSREREKVKDSSLEDKDKRTDQASKEDFKTHEKCVISERNLHVDKKEKLPNGLYVDEAEIAEMKASFEENMRSISGLSQFSQEETKKSIGRVAYRQKSQQKIGRQQDRWTLNDFSSCTSPKKEYSSSSSGSSSPSPVATSKPPPTPSAGERLPYETQEICIREVLTRNANVEISSSATYSSSTSVTTTEREEGLVHLSSSGSSINARLVALQRNGEEGWKSRLQKLGVDTPSERPVSPKLPRSKARPTSLLERVTQLESSSQQWKGRVSQSDATKFTVAHKMASASSVPSLVGSNTEDQTLISSLVSSSAASTSTGFLLSPATERKKRSPQPKVFKSKTGSSIPEMLKKTGISGLDAGRSNVAKEFARSISIPSEGSKDECPTVSIPRPDDDSFNDFFTSSSSILRDSSENVEMDLSDFDHITSNTSQLLVSRHRVRVTRKNQGTRNPLRSLAAREDLKDEYMQVKLGVGERELRRMKIEELSKSSSLAMEALAGLASKENFSAVALKKVEENPVIRELAPYSELMLIQIKGRKHPQVRLVQPCCESVNAGDDFLLITPVELFHYKGQFSNVIERAVASEMALYILQTKDMGVTAALKVTDIEETSPTAKKERFWSKLKGSSESRAMPAGHSDEDDHVEAALIASNKVFEVRGSSLVPLDDAWGQSPKYELLASEKVFVFDFGSEVYFWAGKRAPTEERRIGTVLLKELWKEEYDYSDCDINPVLPILNSLGKEKMKGNRPKWGICAKITENVETILFKEKFLDWPDTAQQTRIKEVRREGDQRADPLCELQPCDVRHMMETRQDEPDLVLEMCHLGRGVEYYDEEERRMHNISTNDFKIWHISEHEKNAMELSSSSHLYCNETYVIRWYYLVTATGRTLKGTPSKHNVTGRSRVAYFFWQGQSSSISDKGVSALMTVELDEERGPHIRVAMKAEPPAFLNLFKGSLVIHRGTADHRRSKNLWKLFVVRGELTNEAHLIEFQVSSTHLRSRGCLVLVDLKSGIVYLWIGSKVMKQSRQVALTAAKSLSQSSAKEIGWQTEVSAVRLKEEYEGSESREFLSGIGCISISKTDYHSLISFSEVYDWTPIIWKLEATNETLQANEIVSPYRASETVSAFPVWQEELYSSAQPALFLIDAGPKTYIWQGWRPDEEVAEEENSSVTGSAFLRFTFARRAALQTALSYVKRKKELLEMKNLSKRSLKVLEPKLVIAGMEPLEFTNLFPVWEIHPEVTVIQKKEGRWKAGVEYSVLDVFEQLCRNRYSLEELQKRPLPDGVDPSRLEKYLSDEEFETTLGMDKDAFYGLVSWKQVHMKKKALLF